MRRNRFLNGGMATATLLTAFVTLETEAHVRQRVYLPVDANGEDGVESIIHWDPAQKVKIHMHAFSGDLDGAAISYAGSASPARASARDIVAEALAEWQGELFPSVPSGLSLDLNGTLPHEDASGCEADTSKDSRGGPDGMNNILFMSKQTRACAPTPLLTQLTGVIGLTRVRFEQNTGRIVEADVSFDDVEFEFISIPGNNLQATPRKKIYLKDVVTHELGHFFGLDHSSVRDSTMLFAVSDGLHSTEPDDRLGFLSLYPSTESAGAMGQVQGSVVTAAGAPYFGAVVFAVDARTLRPVAAEITNPNGAFQFCALPAGNYAFFADRYRPFGTNIHAYYSGDGTGATQDDLGCFNPGCGLMTTSLRLTPVAAEPSVGAGGRSMKVFPVVAGVPSSYLNITGAESDPSLEAIPSTGTGSELTLDEPRLAALGATDLPIGGGAISTVHRYNFVAPASGTVQIRTAALRLYTRLKLSLSLRDAATPEVDATAALCPTLPVADPTNPLAENTVSAKYAVDPWIECENLVAGSSYVLQVSATAAACNEIPGNGSTCVSDNSETASTARPYYLLSVFDPSAAGAATAALSESSLAASTFYGLPSCESYSERVTKGPPKERKDDNSGGCCGTLRTLSSGLPPDGPRTLALTVALSPITWFALWWVFGTRRRAVQILGFRARRARFGALGRLRSWAGRLTGRDSVASVRRGPSSVTQVRQKIEPSAKRSM